MTPVPTPMHDPAADPMGHRLLEERFARLPHWLLSFAAEPPLELAPKTHATRHFVIVGTGSSEAHGRFLEHAINRHTPSSAEFVPISGFLATAPEARRGKTLVVFSQGLSPNAQTAFARRHEFDHLIVFTATTAPKARAAGRTERAQLIERLEAEGAQFIRFPLEDEYTTLIRLVGPVCAYIACWKFVSALGGSRLALPSLEHLKSAVETALPDSLFQDFVRHAGAFRRGFYIVASSPLSEFSQNLSYKFMEGLFWSAPVIWDFLQFAHGPFQEVSLNPRPVLLLRTRCDEDEELAGRTQRMLTQVGLTTLHLDLRHSSLLSLLEAETILGALILRLIRELQIDQVNWPSKGRDDPLYGFFRG